MNKLEHLQISEEVTPESTTFQTIKTLGTLDYQHFQKQHLRNPELHK